MFDTHMIFAVLSTAIVGGLIGLDRTAVGQFMISQPIVAGPLIGWMLGDGATGLVVGAVLELIWLLDMPVGAFVPADSTVASVFAVAAAILGSAGRTTPSLTGFSILLSALLAPITMIADNVIRTFNARLAHIVQSSSGDGLGTRLRRAHVSGLGVFFLKFFVLYLVFIPVGIIAVRVFTHLPDVYHRAMVLFIKLLPLLGTALVARKLSIKTLDLFLLSGFIIAATAGQAFHAPALIVMLLTITGGWLGARYHEQRS